MSQITEWEFTADVASQINEILKVRVDLPFSEARCEDKSITERHIEFIKSLPAPILKSDELLQPPVKEQVKNFLEKTS